MEACGRALQTDGEFPLCLDLPGGLYCHSSPKILTDFFPCLLAFLSYSAAGETCPDGMRVGSG